MVTVGMNYEVVEGKEEVFERHFGNVVEAMGVAAGHVRTHLYRQVGAPRAYWDLHFPAEAPGMRVRRIPLADAAAGVRERLDAAVRKRLMSDVPLGVLLSGGVDSGAVLAQLADPRDSLVLTVGRHEIPVGNLEKPLWPAARPQPVTKRDLLTYLVRVAPWMLPHLEGRPAFPYRMPHGVEGEGFYQRSWDAPPPFVQTVPTWSTDHRGPRPHLVVANLATLLWLAQQGAVEVHAGFARTTR